MPGAPQPSIVMTFRDRPTPLLYLLPLIGVAIVTVASVRAAPVAPAQFYPLYIAVTLVVSAIAGRGAGFVAVAASALAIAYFSLTGADFAVSDPVEAAGLIGLITVDILTVVIVAGYRDWLAIERARGDTLDRNGVAVQASVEDIAHRLRNDLASLAAVAHMGARRAVHGETAEALESLARRIDAQARIYARFDLVGGLDGAVGLKPYLESLCDDFRLAHLSLRPVGIEVSVADVGMVAGRAILLGSIVNELLTNASKHAFPGDRAGTISVVLAPHPVLPDRYRLTVADDGIGLGTEAGEGTGIGRKLLAAMASQLGGGFHIEHVAGMTVGQIDIAL